MEKEFSGFRPEGLEVPSPQEEQHPSADHEKELSRRDFLKKGLKAAAGLGLLGALPEVARGSESGNQEREVSEEDLAGIINGHNVELRDSFSRSELLEIAEILGVYQRELGDLKGFNFNLGHFKFDEDLYKSQSNPKSIFYDESPFKGYYSRGSTNPTNHRVSLAPKTVIDATDEWEREKSEKPEGEEKRNHNFKWVLAHELAHALSFKLGFGYEIMKFGYEGRLYKFDFSKTWVELDDEIGKDPRSYLKSDEKTYKWENKRPMGYPTHYSYFGTSGRSHNHEIFADSAAYYMTDAKYADDDRLFMQRVELIKQLFQQIKQNPDIKIIEPPVEDYDTRF